MADEFQSSAPGRDVVSEEVWYEGRSRWSPLRRLPLRWFRLIALIVAFLLLLALLVYAVTWRSYRTPIIAIGTAPYKWPYPPQAMVAEDLARLSALDEVENVRLLKGIQISSSQAGPMLNADALTDFDLDSDDPIVFYISMCGAVHNGSPYLVPPEASPLDHKSWLAVESLITQLRDQLGEDFQTTPKLFVFDCNRVPQNWYLGWLSNDFSAALKAWWNPDRFPDVAILTSAGPGQRSWTSAELGGSVFAHFFSRGIAGQADTGDWTRRVSLDELSRYLQREVDEWAVAKRASHQLPELLPTAQTKSTLAYPNRDAMIKLDSIQASLGGFQPTLGIQERMDLWEDLADLRKREPYRFEPIAWRGLEHDLLWLDLLASAGTAYAVMAKDQFDATQSELERIESALSGVEKSGSIFDHSGLISDAGESAGDGLRLPSLPLAEFFGTVPQSTVDSVKSELAQFQVSPAPQQLALLRRNLERAGLNDFVEAQFVQMLQRYEFPALWTNSAQLARLLRLRTPISDAGVPRGDEGFIGDERVHHHVRRLVESADKARRIAEDQLFVEGQPNLERDLQAAEGTAKTALDAMSNLQRAARARDRAWAELGYYLQWQADQRRRLSGDSARVQQAIDATKSLENKLFATEAAPTMDLTEVETILKLLEDLQNDLAEECQTLRDDSDASILLRIEAALANPLLTADDRGSLYDRFNTLAANPSAAKVSSDAPPMSPLLSPVLLGQQVSVGEKSDNSEAWRQQIVSLNNDVAGTNSHERPVWAKLEQRVRAMAPLCCIDRPSGKTDLELPVKMLRRFDLQALVMWHARRALDNFWGPAGDAEPYFAVAANDYLDSARTLNGLDEDSAEIAPLRGEVCQAVDASENWLAIQATSAVQIDPSEPVNSKINIEERSGQVPAKSGTAAVFLRENGKRFGGVQWKPSSGIALPIQPTTIDATIRHAAPSNSSDLDVMTMFRGHEAVGPFAIESLGGAIVNVGPHPFKPGRVTLRSPYKKLDIVLVLDCSQSMEQPLEADKTRLAIAKDALSELIGQLGSREDVRIGVRLFGHRVGWSVDRPVRVLTAPTYDGEIPPDLTPERDVERILPLATVDFNAAQQVFAALSRVNVGWGQSPLYYSLAETLREDFSDATPDSDSHVIVITDGRNYQARPTAGESSSVSEVVQAASRSRAKIHILALSPNAGNDQSTASQTAQLALRTQGTYKELTGSLDLRQTLNSLVRHDEYQLEDTAGNPVARDQLGVQLSDPSQQGPASYSVRFENLREALRLDGGEAIELYTRARDPQLYAFPFNYDVVKFAGLTLPGQPQDVQQRIHRPVRDERGVDFPVSLQRNLPAAGPDSWRWTPRPAAAWIDITPLTSSRQVAGQTYPFYDANYEPDQPVPLLKLKAANWPAGATRAAISAWYQTQSTSPEVKISLADVIGANGAAATLSRELREDVRIQIDAGYLDASRKLYRVRVTEFHGPTQGNTPWLKVSPASRVNLQPAQIERQFDSRYGVAVHRFDYADPYARLLPQLRAGNIGITTRQQALAGAARAESTEVEVFDARDLLPLTGGPTKAVAPPPESTAITPVN